MKNFGLKSLLLLILFCLTSIIAFSQKTVKSAGKSTIKIEKDMSEKEAIKIARDEAIIDAIEKAFGTIVYEGNNTYIKNKTTGKKTESEVVFNSISNTIVNGEWVKETKNYSSVIDKDGYNWVTYKIWGEVREIVSIPANFTSATLNCPELKCQTESLNSGQSIYFHFKSPVDGFVNIYFDSNHETYMVLPYKRSNYINYPVKADKDYYFFSKNLDYANDKAAIDEYQLDADSPSDLYKVFVLFSPEAFDKPMLTDKTKEMLSENDLSKKYTLPKSLKSVDFQKWLQSLRSHNKKIQLKTLTFTVKKT